MALEADRRQEWEVSGRAWRFAHFEFDESSRELTLEWSRSRAGIQAPRGALPVASPRRRGGDQRGAAGIRLAPPINEPGTRLNTPLETRLA